MDLAVRIFKSFLRGRIEMALGESRAPVPWNRIAQVTRRRHHGPLGALVVVAVVDVVWSGFPPPVWTWVVC